MTKKTSKDTFEIKLSKPTTLKFKKPTPEELKEKKLKKEFYDKVIGKKIVGIYYDVDLYGGELGINRDGGFFFAPKLQIEHNNEIYLLLDNGIILAVVPHDEWVSIEIEDDPQVVKTILKHFELFLKERRRRAKK
jgi:hypothetical protein